MQNNVSSAVLRQRSLHAYLVSSPEPRAVFQSRPSEPPAIGKEERSTIDDAAASAGASLLPPHSRASAHARQMP